MGYLFFSESSAAKVTSVVFIQFCQRQKVCLAREGAGLKVTGVLGLR